MWLSTKLPSLLLQGNLLRGIDNYWGAARSALQVRKNALDNSFTNSFTNNFSFFFQLKIIKKLPKKLPMVKKTQCK